MTGLEMRYFILKPLGNTAYHKASRAAMRKYANMIREENPKMAEDLDTWHEREWIKNLNYEENTEKNA